MSDKPLIIHGKYSKPDSYSGWTNAQYIQFIRLLHFLPSNMIHPFPFICYLTLDLDCLKVCWVIFSYVEQHTGFLCTSWELAAFCFKSHFEDYV